MAVSREMSMEMEDSGTGREVDVIGLGCSKEAFTEHEEVCKIIDEIPSLTTDSQQAKRNWQRFSFVLDQYQEQPHLIDPHLEKILEKIITLIRNESLDPELKHETFRYLYFIAKVRGYKVVTRLLPHEISDLEPLLKYLESENPKDVSKWETHYGLLLWFSMVMKIPFHLKRFDSGATLSVMDRILTVCKNFLATTTAAQDMASYLTGIYITRPDVKELYLPGFWDWAQQALNEGNVHFKKGVILSLAGIFKHGQREYLLLSASNVLHFVLNAKFPSYELAIIKKPLVKLIQRIGMIFLKPRLAPWRYQRGSRSLAANLSSTVPNGKIESVHSATADLAEDDEDDVPEEIELVLEEILHGLRDKNREVQYSAAKGIGRLTNRLSKSFADQVVESILELFSLKESDMAWHGGCLALAELARRGLLLPQRLSHVIPLVEQAMLYDELRGNFSVGSAVRDAACYLCWAFARAYDPALLQPYVHQLAKALLVMTVFDREVNCRRAAASAFQEHVGRQGTFPHGIEILTTCDYFAVGLRKNAYLNLSLYVAQHPEYRRSLIEHLVDRKIMHWDTSIRELTSQALHKLTFLDPMYTKKVMMTKIVSNCTHPDLHLRHGSILATGEILNALCIVAEEKKAPLNEYLEEEAMLIITDLCHKIIDERFLRSFGGDQMRLALSKFIENCSTGHLPLPLSIIEPWLAVLRDCLASADVSVQQAAVKPVAALINQYFSESPSDVQAAILERFNVDMSSSNQQARMGNSLALGSMPKFMLAGNLSRVINNMCQVAEITESTLQWAESRKNALSALAQIAVTVGIADPGADGIDEELLNQIFQTLMKGIDDYTVDSRGDIGAIVRESAMSSLQMILEISSKSRPDYLKPEMVSAVLSALVKQATEQIRRTRLLAATVFYSLIYCDPPIPHIVHIEELRSIIPCAPLDMSTEKECFDLWIQVMQIQPYRKPVITGLISSIGSLTESLVKSASAPFFTYLRQLVSQNELQQLQTIAEDILDIFQSNLGNARFMPYLFSFLDHISSSGCLDLVFKSVSQKLFSLIRTEMSSGSKPMKLLLTSIDLYCHLLRGDETTFEKCITHLLSLLLSRFPRVRKITATKLYETLLTLTDISEELSANQDEILSLLSDTNWDEDIERLKPVRGRLKELFHPTYSAELK